MPHIEVLWTEANIAHLAANSVSPQEAEDVLVSPIGTAVSRSTGNPIVFGNTRAGRRLAVVYEQIDPITVYPITAYDVED